MTDDSLMTRMVDYAEDLNKENVNLKKKVAEQEYTIEKLTVYNRLDKIMYFFIGALALSVLSIIGTRVIMTWIY